jgi:hypothetical protein
VIIVGTRILKKIDTVDVGEGSGRDVIACSSVNNVPVFRVFCPIVKNSARRRHHSDKPGLYQTWMKRRQVGPYTDSRINHEHSGRTLQIISK